MVTGFVVGSIFNEPLRWWGRSCAKALVRIAPMTVLITGLLWVLTHRIVDAMTDGILFTSGVVLVAGGLVLRVGRHRASATTAADPRIIASENLMGLGLGVATSAPVLMGLTALVCFSRWSDASDPMALSLATRPAWVHDSLYVVGAIAAVGAIQALKGLVPLQ
ncbi:MAG: hypothetical protein ACXW34_05230, partial [Nitrospira sp.]